MLHATASPRNAALGRGWMSLLLRVQGIIESDEWDVTYRRGDQCLRSLTLGETPKINSGVAQHKGNTKECSGGCLCYQAI